MAEQQTQCTCNRCETLTLHTRAAVPFNHVFHILPLIFCFGLWIPIWVLAWMLHEQYPEPFRCSRCGQAEGNLTAEQHAASDVAKHTAEIYASVRREQKRRAQEPLRRMRQEQRRAIKAKLVACTRRFPGQVDAFLASVAGEGNAIIHQSLRTCVVAAIVFISAAALLCIFLGVRAMM